MVRILLRALLFVQIISSLLFLHALVRLSSPCFGIFKTHNFLTSVFGSVPPTFYPRIYLPSILTAFALLRAISLVLIGVVR